MSTLSKLNQKFWSDNFSQFFHFFAIFTGIFVAMTVIILQIMRYGVYSSVDSNLKNISSHAQDYAEMVMTKSLINDFMLEKDSSAKGKNLDQPSANTNFVLYSSNGTILNDVNDFLNLDQSAVDTKHLNSIQDESIANIYNQVERYRTITIKVKSKIYPTIAYLKVIVNVEQLAGANQRYEKIIIVVMSLFWILSVGASVYLANWSRRPILESYEKQKFFVENASHELRTPLAVLQNRLEALFRKPNETILENSENIASSLEEVRNMRILTTNLLNLARRDDGMTPEIVSIRSSEFDDIFSNYEIIAEESGKIFHAHNEITREIKSDKTLLKQLMTILFDNALKYTDSDGVIDFTVKCNDKNLYLIIADNGPGIKDEDKRKIFDRFYRIDKARTRQMGGFGLGLSLAQQIVHSLKGTITVRDNHPKGTIFEIKL